MGKEDPAERSSMGFIRRLLGIETRPGEPEPLTDSGFDAAAAGSDLPVFVFFFSLWCSSCQVTGGLLNELGPEYASRARFYKIDATKNPAAAAKMNVRGVPAVIALSGGKVTGRSTGLIPLDQLRDWIEESLARAEGAEGKEEEA